MNPLGKSQLDRLDEILDGNPSSLQFKTCWYHLAGVSRHEITDLAVLRSSFPLSNAEIYARFKCLNNVPGHAYIRQANISQEDLERVSLRKGEPESIQDILSSFLFEKHNWYIGVHNPGGIDPRLNCGEYGADLIIIHAKAEDKRTIGFVDFLDKKAYTPTRENEGPLGKVGLEWHDLQEVYSNDPLFKTLASIENQGDPSSSRIF